MKAKYENIFRSVPAGLLAVDLKKRLVEFNPVAEQLTGYKRQEVLGRCCRDLLWGGPCGKPCPCDFPERSSTDGYAVAGEAEVVTKAGGRLPVHFSCRQIKDNSGRTLGAIGLLHDIREQKEQEASRSNTLAMIAHDIKTPIISLGAFLSRMIRGKAGPVTEEQRSYLDLMLKEVDRVQRLLTTFIEVARLQSGSLSLSPEICNVAQKLLEVVETFRPLAGKKGINIRLEVPRELSWVIADGQQLHRVFFNLLNNALAYTDASGSVVVRAQEKSTSLCIQFQDNGRGIAPEDLPHIFDPYYHRAHLSPEEGSGLGLAIAKAIIRAHGGRIQVESKPGQGSLFSLFLPKVSRA